MTKESWIEVDSKSNRVKDISEHVRDITEMTLDEQ